MIILAFKAAVVYGIYLWSHDLGGSSHHLNVKRAIQGHRHALKLLVQNVTCGISCVSRSSIMLKLHVIAWPTSEKYATISA